MVFLSSLKEPTTISARKVLGLPQRSHHFHSNSLSLPILSTQSSNQFESSNNFNSNTRRNNHNSSSSSSSSRWVANHPLAPRPETGSDMSLDPKGIDNSVFEEESVEYHLNRIQFVPDSDSDSQPQPQQDLPQFSNPTQESMSRLANSNSMLLHNPLPSASLLLSKSILSSNKPSISIPSSISLLKDFLNLGTDLSNEDPSTIYTLAALRSLRLGLRDEVLIWLRLSPSSFEEGQINLPSETIQRIREEREEEETETIAKDEGEKSISNKELWKLIFLHSLNSTSKITTDLNFLTELLKEYSSKGWLSDQTSTRNLKLFQDLLARILRYSSPFTQTESSCFIEVWKSIVLKSRKSSKEQGDVTSIYLEKKGLPNLFGLIIRTLTLAGKFREAEAFIRLSGSFIFDASLSEREVDAKEFGFEIHTFTYKLIVEEIFKNQRKFEGQELGLKAEEIERGLIERQKLNVGSVNEVREGNQKGLDNKTQELPVDPFISSFPSLSPRLKIKENRPQDEKIKPVLSQIQVERLSKSQLNRNLEYLLKDAKVLELRKARNSMIKALRNDLKSQTLEVKKKSKLKLNLEGNSMKSLSFNHLPSVRNLAKFLFRVSQKNQKLSKVKTRSWRKVKGGLRRTRILRSPYQRPVVPRPFYEPLLEALRTSRGGKGLIESSILFETVNTRIGMRNEKRYLRGLKYYKENFLMGENEGCGGICEEVFGSVGIKEIRLEDIPEGRQLGFGPGGGRRRRSEEDGISQDLLRIEKGSFSGKKIWPSSHSIPIILKALINLAVSDSRKILWHKDLNFRKGPKVERLSLLYDCWIQKAFPFDSNPPEDQVNSSTSSIVIEKRSEWGKILNISSTSIPFNPSPPSAIITTHAFDQFIRGFLSIRETVENQKRLSHSTNQEIGFISNGFSKALQVLNHMETKGILKPTVSTWTMILEAVAREGRDFKIPSSQETSETSLNNGLAWKRTKNLAKELGIIIDRTEDQEQEHKPSLPLATLATYTSLIRGLISVKKFKGGPMLKEAREVVKAMYLAASRNQKARNGASSRKDRESGNEYDSSVGFTINEIRRNPLTRGVLLRLEKLESMDLKRLELEREREKLEREREDWGQNGEKRNWR